MNWETGIDECAWPCVKSVDGGNPWCSKRAQLGVLF